MSNIFSIISGLEVTSDEVVKAELFAQQYLQDRFPDIDFRQGTGVRDMVIRPNAMMIALINKALDVYFAQNSLSGVTNASSEELVDNIMSNMFISRRQGSNAKISVRIYFRFPGDRPQVVQVPSSAYFSTNNEHKYYPEESITLYPPVSTPIPGRTYMQYDSSGNLWYADIHLVSEAPDEVYNTTEGDLLYFTIFSPYFIKGEILFLIDQAIPKEKNEEMKARSYTSISTRNLINNPSITSRMMDVFNYIRNVHSEGMGDPNMYRDLAEINHPINAGEKVTVHRGGMVDVYVSTPTRTVVNQWSTDENGVIYIPGSVYFCERSPVSGSPDGDDDLIPVAQPFTLERVGCSNYTNGLPDTPQQDIGLSADQVIKIDFGTDFPLKTASFITKEFSNVREVQSFLDDKQDRVVTADYLARSYEPHSLRIDVRLHTPTSVAKEVAEAAVKEFIESIPNGGSLFISDLYGIFDDLGIKGIVAPLTVNVVHTDKGGNATSYAITDKKELPVTHKFVLETFSLEVQ